MEIVQKGTVSVAYVLRTTYEKFLVDYEEYKNGKHIWTTWPHEGPFSCAVEQPIDQDSGHCNSQETYNTILQNSPEQGKDKVFIKEESFNGVKYEDKIINIDRKDKNADIMVAAALQIENESNPCNERLGQMQNISSNKSDCLESIANELLHMHDDCNPAKDLKSQCYSEMKNDYRVKAEEAEDVGVVEVKKCNENVNGHHMQRRSESKIEDRHKDVDEFNQICEVCYGGDHDDKMLLCDRCNKGFHMFCLIPPLFSVPEDEWLCPLCKVDDVVGDENVGFLEGENYTFEEFKVLANNFARDYLNSKEGHSCDGTDQGDEYAIDVKVAEKLFWEIVEKHEYPVEVSYAADLDTSKFGSGFVLNSDNNREMSKWNLNLLPRLAGAYSSLLQHTTDGIPGVVVPWLYFGMMFSSFCWHVEDHMFYSINYHHFGKPKVWYAVPSSSSQHFEKVFRQTLPQQFEAQPDLLYHLTTMLSPGILIENQVPVYRTIQEEGMFVITFPNGYHSGFNVGLNCAEAVNFAPNDWLRFGYQALERYALYNRRPPLSHEELIIAASKNIIHSFESCDNNEGRIDEFRSTALWLHADINRILNTETRLRYELYSKGVKNSRCMPPGIGLTRSTAVNIESIDSPNRVSCESRECEDNEGEALCSICKSSLYISGCECECSPGRAACMNHIDMLCCCENSRKTLLYRFPLSDLQKLKDKLNFILSATTKSSSEDEDFITSSLEKIRNGSALNDSESLIDFKDLESDQTHLASVWEKKASSFLYARKDEQMRENSFANDSPNIVLQTIQDLASNAVTFSWAGTAIHNVAPSLYIVNELLHWSNDVMFASMTSSESKMKLEIAEEILSRPKSIIGFDYLTVSLQFEGLDSLKHKVVEARALCCRIDEAMSRKDLPLKTLKLLRNDAILNGLTVPSEPVIIEAIKSINSWENRVRKLIPKSRHDNLNKNKYKYDKKCRPLISDIETILEEGKNLPAALNRMKELEDAMQDVLTWQKKAQHTLSCSRESNKIRFDVSKGLRQSYPTLVELQLLNYQSEDLKMIVDEMAEIEKLVMAGEGWLLEFESIKHEFGKVEIGLMEGIVERGEVLPIEISELNTLKQQVGLRKWQMHKKVMSKTKLYASEISQILCEGLSLPEPPSQADIDNLKQRIRDADEWQCRVDMFMRPKAKVKSNTTDREFEYKIKIADLQQIVNQGNRIAVRLDDLSILSLKLMEAQNWVGRANTILLQRKSECRASTRGKNPSDDVSITTLKGLDALIAEAETFDVSLDEYVASLLQIKENALQWSQDARALVKAFDIESFERNESGNYYHKCCKMFEKGKAFGLTLDGFRQLEMRIFSLEWDMRAQKICKPMSCDSKKESLHSLIDHLRSSNGLMVNQEMLNRLENQIARGESWEKKAKRLLEPKKQNRKNEDCDFDHDDSKTVSKNDVNKFFDLLLEAEEIPVLLPSVCKIENMVKVHKDWEMKARKLLHSDMIGSANSVDEIDFEGDVFIRKNDRVSYSKLKLLARDQEGSVIASEVHEEIQAIVIAADKWIDKCRRTISRRGMHDDALSLLQALLASVDRSLVKQQNQQSEADDTILCLCQSTVIENSSTFVCCDSCDQWFHMRCVGITKVMEKKLKNFECVFCKAIDGDFLPLASKVSTDYKRYRTGRPHLDALVELMKEENQLLCKTDEGNTLVKVFHALQKLQARCSNAFCNILNVELKLDEKEEQNQGGEIKSEFDQNALHGHSDVGCDDALNLELKTGVSLPIVLPSEPELDVYDQSSKFKKVEAIEALNCLKACLALEIKYPKVEAILLQCLFRESWEAKMKKILQFTDEMKASLKEDFDHKKEQPQEKASLEEVQSMVEIAEILQLHRENFLNVEDKKLKPKDSSSVVSIYEQSISLVSKVLDWLDLHSSITSNPDVVSVEEIQHHLELSFDLPLNVPDMDNLQQLLRDMCVQYCVCRSRYDPTRPMICCDGCDEWFHYECVGLPIPDENDEEDGAEDQAFLCPKCSESKLEQKIEMDCKCDQVDVGQDKSQCILSGSPIDAKDIRMAISA